MTTESPERKAAQAEQLLSCATGIESSVVGIISTLLADPTLDEQLQTLKRDLFEAAHDLRVVAAKLST